MWWSIACLLTVNSSPNPRCAVNREEGREEARVGFLQTRNYAAAVHGGLDNKTAAHNPRHIFPGPQQWRHSSQGSKWNPDVTRFLDPYPTGCWQWILVFSKHEAPHPWSHRCFTEAALAPSSVGGVRLELLSNVLRFTWRVGHVLIHLLIRDQWCLIKHLPSFGGVRHGHFVNPHWICWQRQRLWRELESIISSKSVVSFK